MPQQTQSTTVDRGWVGVTPRLPTLEDESYADYMEGVRNFAIRELFPVVGDQVTSAARAASLPDDGESGPYADVAKVTNSIPLVGVWKRIMRSQQQMTWEKLQESYASNRSQYEAELAAAERIRPEGLSYDADFEVPDYAKYPIHLQPGGYVGDTLAGYVFHHGTRVFYQGENDQDELHKQVADFLAPPATGTINRVLDVGCSIGQCTTALKQRFPHAEVEGLDVSLPLLRYANRRAIDLDVDVHFRQGLAEALPYQDSEFDSVLAFILFHEVPKRLFRPIIDEVFRVLRPGGSFTVIDAPNGHAFPVHNRMWMDFDAQYNCEPFAPAFIATDLQVLLEDAGFTAVSEGPTPTFLRATTAIRPC